MFNLVWAVSLEHPGIALSQHLRHEMARYAVGAERRKRVPQFASD
jgi:hypothetical protein